MDAYYIDETRKPHKIKGGFIGIDGKARKIKKGYIGVDNVARLCFTTNSFDPVFTNNTWDDVIAACQTNSVPDAWNVGDSMTMTIDGTDYQIDIIGKNHDDYSDGSGKAPLTFQLHNCYDMDYRLQSTSTNGMGWNGCDLRLIHLPSVLSKMPIEVQNAIKEVDKSTVVGGQYGTDVYITQDKLFALSEIEIFGTRTFSKNGEGSQYEYYKNGGDKIKEIEDTACEWWTRSPQANSSLCFCKVDTLGSPTVDYPNVSESVSFAFCF